MHNYVILLMLVSACFPFSIIEMGNLKSIIPTWLLSTLDSNISSLLSKLILIFVGLVNCLFQKIASFYIVEFEKGPSVGTCLDKNLGSLETRFWD